MRVYVAVQGSWRSEKKPPSRRLHDSEPAGKRDVHLDGIIGADAILRYSRRRTESVQRRCAAAP